MPNEPQNPQDDAPRKDEETPRSDQAPRREPYHEGYFGTEEEGVVRQREATDEEAERAPLHEDAAGGDREI
jgi:hypothetical protein